MLRVPQAAVLIREAPWIVLADQQYTSSVSLTSYKALQSAFSNASRVCTITHSCPALIAAFEYARCLVNQRHLPSMSGVEGKSMDTVRTIDMFIHVSVPLK
jgi:hypothetical protein